MGKPFSEIEKEQIKQDLLSNGAKLIRQKGLRRVTVEDITQSIGIAKGSFYSFFSSRESLFWEVIKREEDELIETIKIVAREELPTQDKVRKIFLNLFLQEKSFAFHLDDVDRLYLIERLPKEMMDKEKARSVEVLQSLLGLCNLAPTKANAEYLMAMLQTLRQAASSSIFTSEKRRKDYLRILVDAFVNALVAGMEK